MPRYDDEDDRDRDDRPRRSRREEEDRPRKQESNGLAVASLVLGILSFCTLGLAGVAGVSAR
ncbi:MAG: hypothetical protein K2V38_07440 [Gemmataceae bacterium]|nr:hypothetical protein [Gemmataceae bacterium]